MTDEVRVLTITGTKTEISDALKKVRQSGLSGEDLIFVLDHVKVGYEPAIEEPAKQKQPLPVGRPAMHGVKSKFGTLIKARREELGFTVEDIAEFTGISATSIYRYEKGKSRPVTEYALKLADALEIDPVDFLDKEG